LLGKSAAKLAGREPDGGLAASLPALPTRRTRFSTPIVRDGYALDPQRGPDRTSGELTKRDSVEYQWGEGLQ